MNHIFCAQLFTVFSIFVLFLAAMKEMKRTDYSYMKAGIVASRDFLCINEKLKCMSNVDKTYVCASLNEKDTDEDKNDGIKERCPYSGDVSDGLNYLESNNCPIPDIEDLERAGRITDCCPYYMSKSIVIRADIVFMPYNYLFDPKIRFANKFNLRNAIVILDEAHNVESMCEDAAGTLITSTKIGIALRDINFVISLFFFYQKYVEKIFLMIAIFFRSLTMD